MEEIISGLLMLKNMTSYEIRSYIKSHFSMMCSDSAGSIQSALKKLLAAGRITYKEAVENSINKKWYSLTKTGREDFLAWMDRPMNHRKSKNMELSKLYFMGLLGRERQFDLLEAHMEGVAAECEGLKALKQEITKDLPKEFPKGLSKKLPAKNKEQEQANRAPDKPTLSDEVRFQLITLDYGIALFEFEKQWYQKLIADLKEEEADGDNI